MRTAVLAVLCLSTSHAFAAHTLGLGQPPKYPAGFKTFDYVNPDAPKGGTFTLPVQGGFDTLNPSAPKGDHEAGMAMLTLDTLMEKSLDEPFTMYGLLTEDTALASDGLSVTLRLNPKAKFHNGDSVLAEDVAYSFKTLTQDRIAASMYKFYWVDVAAVETPALYTMMFRLKKRNAELHMILSELPVFSHKSFPKGLEAATNTPPVGSGPYRLAKAEGGRLSKFIRDKGYWAWSLPAGRGRHSFDVVRFKYFKDDSVRIEGVKSGQYDFVQENIARSWVRVYPADMLKGRGLSKHEWTQYSTVGMQGFVMNMRRKPFDDIHVRRAIVESFGFDNINSRLSYSACRHSNSFFTNSDMTVFSRPSGGELALLESLRTQLPAAVFMGNVPEPSKTDLKTGVHPQLLKACALLEQAGYCYRNSRLEGRQGRPLTFEFLSPSKTCKRVIAKWQRDLAKISVGMAVRLADSAVYQKRINGFDFDMTITVYANSESPGNEQFDYFSCASAKTDGSRNLAGVCSPAVEILLKGFGGFKNRREQTTSARALDRVIRHQYITVPNWFSNRYRIVYRDMLGILETLSQYYSPVAWAVGMGWKK